MTSSLMNSFLSLYWLRPENALGQIVDALLIIPELDGKAMLDFGCGNGYFTFIMSGGRFTEDYDFFVNSDTAGFDKGRDIYNIYKKDIGIKSYICKNPEIKFKTGLDHKQALLDQSSELGLYDNLVCLDANKRLPFDDGDFDVIFSNILYWLKDPFKVLEELERILRPGGKIVLTFPNNNLYKLCPSYSWKKQKYPEIWKKLNRSRSKSILWTKSIEELSRLTDLSMERSKVYYAPTTLLFWDIGLRPLSAPLIKMANKLSPEDRREVKRDFMKTCLPYIGELLKIELSSKKGIGGWNFVVLRKK